jgi:alginate O-acetyltransferase complex protein AlgI
MVYRRFAAVWDKAPTLVAQGVTFLLVVIGWVFFRSTDFSMAAHLLTTMFVPTDGKVIGDFVPFSVLLGFAGLWSIAGPNAFDLHGGFQWRQRYAFPLAVAFGVSLAIMAGGKSSPFLYFQF